MFVRHFWFWFLFFYWLFKVDSTNSRLSVSAFSPRPTRPDSTDRFLLLPICMAVSPAHSGHANVCFLHIMSQYLLELRCARVELMLLQWICSVFVNSRMLIYWLWQPRERSAAPLNPLMLPLQTCAFSQTRPSVYYRVLQYFCWCCVLSELSDF